MAVIDADLIGRKKHRFPNLCSMKLSAYYKKINNQVELKTNYDNLEQYDKVFISKVFTDTDTPGEILKLPNVEYGGTGWFYDKAPPLPDEIEHIMPDYHLYDGWVNGQIRSGSKPKDFTYFTDWSIGKMTVGCIRQCSFCVNKNYTKSTLHSPVNEFLDESRKYICILDDNVFACKDWRYVFFSLQNTGKRFQFKQGLDERLLTEEKIKILFESKWIGDYIFAFDNIKDKEIIIDKLKLLRKYTSRVPKFYTFCAYNHEDPDYYNEQFWKQDIIDAFERIKILMQYQCLPYIMRYKDYEFSPHKGTYVNLSRWCNQPQFFKKMSYREFCEENGRVLNDPDCSTMRYMKEIENKYPEIAKQYFDMKYGEV